MTHEINWTKNIKALKREIFQQKKKVKETTFSSKLSHERKKTLKKPKLTGTKLETNVGKGKKKNPSFMKKSPGKLGRQSKGCCVKIDTESCSNTSPPLPSPPTNVSNPSCPSLSFQCLASLTSFQILAWDGKCDKNEGRSRREEMVWRHNQLDD